MILAPFLVENQVWATFAADVAPGAVKIGAKCAQSGPSEALKHETMPKRDLQREVFSEDFDAFGIPKM